MNCNIKNLKGEQGGEYITADASAHEGDFDVILPLTDAVLNAATACNLTGLAASGATLPKGVPVPGYFTSITLTSGTIIAYKRVK